MKALLKKLLRRQNWPRIAVLITIAATIALLRWQGRPWWCACGQLRLWVGDAFSSHTSQHLADPYSFTHLQHGLVLFWLVSWAAKKWKWPWQRWLAVAIEAGWELLENTKFIIDRYRETTAALGYTGDSILNSLGDILFCYVGLHVARKLGWRNTWLLFLAIEAVLLLTIRDSLLLNIVMLLAPIDAIKTWQQG
ncbi:MAG: DUF2585 family protein [Aeoliella sp.]